MLATNQLQDTSVGQTKLQEHLAQGGQFVMPDKES